MTPRQILVIILALIVMHVLIFLGVMYAASRAQVINFQLGVKPAKTSFHDVGTPGVIMPSAARLAQCSGGGSHRENIFSVSTENPDADRPINPQAGSLELGETGLVVPGESNMELLEGSYAAAGLRSNFTRPSPPTQRSSKRAQ